jgi:type I restriction enzyme S subunit
LDRARIVRFGDVVVNKSEVASDPLSEGLVRAVGLEHLDSGSIYLQRWGKSSEASFTRRFGPGDVLFAKRRVYQRKAAMATFDGVCSGDILVFGTRGDDLLPALLPFVVCTDAFVQWALRTSAGSLSPRTRWKDLADFEFLLPGLEAQSELVTLLQAIELASERVRSVLETTSTVSLAFALNAGSSRGRDTPLAECLRGIEAGKSLPGSPLAPEDGKPAVLKVSAVGDGEFLPLESKTLLDDRAFVAPAAVRAGDLLMTRANTSDLVGRVCRVSEDFPNLMLSDKTLRLVVDEDAVRPDYAEIALRLPPVRKQLRVLATGTGSAMKNISQAKLRTLSISVPPLDVQDEIVRVEKASRRGRNAFQAQLERLARLKTAALDERLIGRP